jgi:hypothetical protein
MLSAGFKPAIPASDRQQKHALNRASTGIGSEKIIYFCHDATTLLGLGLLIIEDT